MKSIDPTAFYRPEEVELISASTLSKMRTRGTGPRFVKRGKRVLYRGMDLIAFFEAGAACSTHETSGKIRDALAQEKSAA